MTVVELRFIESKRESGRVWFTQTGYGKDYEIREKRDSERPYHLTKWVGSPVTFNTEKTTFEEAKAAAQLDFDQHIMRAIEPSNTSNKGAD